jgi:hypothetical protein
MAHNLEEYSRLYVIIIARVAEFKIDLRRYSWK